MIQKQHSRKTDPLEEIRRLCREIPALLPYEGALLYRDVVRLEIPILREQIQDPNVARKYDIYASTYTRPQPRQAFTDHNFAQKLIPALELVRSGEVKTILDGACGLGFETVLFALHGKSIHANDCVEGMVDGLRLRAAFYRELLGNGFDLTVHRSNIMKGDPALDRYDMMYIQEAISHIHPAEDFIVLARERYLNPGGRLVVCDSNHWNPVTRIRVSRNQWRQYRTLRHCIVELTDPLTGEKFPMAEERLFSPHRVKGFMDGSGLRVERVEMSCFLFPWMFARSVKDFGVFMDRLLGRTPGFRAIGGFYTVVGQKPEE